MSGVDRAARYFWPKVARPTIDGCWVWTAALANGYGHSEAFPDISRCAHRIAYTLLVGPIPDGLSLDHLCRNKPCVNPAHLEPVTNRENVLRGDTIAARNVRKTHCPQGHAYDSDNTYLRTRPQGVSRHCIACNRASAREFSQRRRVRA